jgi:hypothetical protein
VDFPVALIRHLSGDECADLLGLPPPTGRTCWFVAAPPCAGAGRSRQEIPLRRPVPSVTDRLLEGFVRFYRQGCKLSPASHKPWRRLREAEHPDCARPADAPTVASRDAPELA